MNHWLTCSFFCRLLGSRAWYVINHLPICCIATLKDSELIQLFCIVGHDSLESRARRHGLVDAQTKMQVAVVVGSIKKTLQHAALAARAALLKRSRSFPAHTNERTERTARLAQPEARSHTSQRFVLEARGVARRNDHTWTATWTATPTCARP